MVSLPEPISGLATIPEAGAAPKQRVASATDARKLSDGLKQEDQIPAYTRKLVNGIVRGDPPFVAVPHDLAWMPNINFMEGAAMIESARVPYYQLLNVESYIEVDCDYRRDDPKHDEWELTIAAKFTEMVKRWPEWFWEYQRKDYEMLKHGVGPIMFEDYPNWRFRAMDCGALKVPANTESCISARMPYCVIFHPERIHSLWAKIRDTEAATKAGWDVENVRLAIMYAMKGQHQLQSWDYYERILDERDLVASSDGDVINCATLLVTEFSGKVSRFMFTEGLFATPEPLKESNTGFLYSSIGKYDEYGECVVAFFQELGDGRWHSVKGLGSKAYRHLAVSNQMKCRMLASAEMTCGLTLQLTDTKSKDGAQLIQRGMVNYIPPGAKYVQLQQAGYLDGPITVDRILTNHLASNLGQFSPRNLAREDGKGEMPTATQVNQQVMRDTSLNQGQIALHYTTLDSMFCEMFRRACIKGTTDEEAQRFQQECKDAGVPIESLTKCCVRANRLSGYGSAQMRQMSDQEMLQSGAVAAMPPEGQWNFWRHYVGGVKGSDKIESFFPATQAPTDDTWVADMENAAIHAGTTPPAIGDDIIHCQIHAQDIEQTLSPVKDALDQGQRDPQQLGSAMQYVQTMTPHFEQHVGNLAKNPQRKKEAKLFQTQFNQFVSFSGKLRGAMLDAQRQQQIAAMQQQQATALGVMDQAKLQSAQVDDQIKTVKAKRDIQRKDEKATADIALKRATAINDANLKRLNTIMPNGNQ